MRDAAPEVQSCTDSTCHADNKKTGMREAWARENQMADKSALEINVPTARARSISHSKITFRLLAFACRRVGVQ
jgi:hypothetical protein